ncbi:MAG: sigma-70 family RNA polymerase sigma factor [Planctomycetota bacterium]
MPIEPEKSESVGRSGQTPDRSDITRTGPDLHGMAVLWMGAQSSVAAFVWASIGNYQDAEDIVQQVATDVAEHFDRYNQEQPFLPWAMAIAKHKVIDYYRKNAKKRIHFGSVQLDQLVSATSQYREVSSAEFDALEQCMSSLPIKTRRLFEMRYLSDMKPQSIAQRIGTTANTVSVALSRARTQLAQCLRNRLSQAEAQR